MRRTLSLGLAAGLAATGFCVVIAACTAQGDEAIDWNRARTLHQRMLRGEKLTPGEQAYHDRAARLLTSRSRLGSTGLTPRESTGFPPVTDLKDDKYKGESGGLYGAGKNDPPSAHLAHAMKEAANVRPLDADGKVATGGKIGLLSIGMSNTTQEFSRFKQIADSDPRKSPRVVIVDGAQGGQAADQWLDPDNSPRAKQVWDVVEDRLRSSGVSDRQVQVVWIKQALIQQGQFGDFPAHAKHMQASLEKIVRQAKQRFPNLRIAYLSSRIYGGYATTTLNPEPYAYEGAFAVRWVIHDQIEGDPQLNCDVARGAVRAPVLLWGPYLWSDGTKGRKLDGLVWVKGDLRSADGTHPSESGYRKVADMLLRFFTTDRTARKWFLREPAKP